MSQKRRMRKLQRKARNAKRETTRPSQMPIRLTQMPIRLTQMPMRFPPMPSLPGGDMLMNEHDPSMEMIFPDSETLEAFMKEDPECQETLILDSGVMIRVYHRRLKVLAPRIMDGDPAFREMLGEVMIDRFCGRDKLMKAFHQEGFIASTNLLADVVVDDEYYDVDDDDVDDDGQ